ncbi:uncharacterized protein LOC126373370 [Pectinophora gossypiella]|uniref:uncharacterized protein LOC126373370 n=1 Tax=Pectinophora gossypiella TaxID=13191 RepID=UPI00214E030A|nr:uncharacterized protein LOC126373370 [Pectinophora gossypiella]
MTEMKSKMKQESTLHWIIKAENWCLQLENWGKIFAVVNCILTFGFCVVAAGAALWILSDTMSLVKRAKYEKELNHTYFGQYVYFMLLLSGGLVLIFILTLSSFAFAIVLAKGVFKRNAEYVKIYFWYGVVVIALSCAGGLALSVLLLCPFQFDEGFFGSAVFYIFASIACYAPFLIPIYFIYKKIQREPSPASSSVAYVQHLVRDAEKCYNIHKKNIMF